MARRKSALRTRFKSVTVEGASTTHVDDETNQEMHKASMQGQFVYNLFFIFVGFSLFIFVFVCLQFVLYVKLSLCHFQAISPIKNILIDIYL